MNSTSQVIRLLLNDYLQFRFASVNNCAIEDKREMDVASSIDRSHQLEKIPTKAAPDSTCVYLIYHHRSWSAMITLTATLSPGAICRRYCGTLSTSERTRMRLQVPSRLRQIRAELPQAYSCQPARRGRHRQEEAVQGHSLARSLSGRKTDWLTDWPTAWREVLQQTTKATATIHSRLWAEF